MITIRLQIRRFQILNTFWLLILLVFNTFWTRCLIKKYIAQAGKLQLKREHPSHLISKGTEVKKPRPGFWIKSIETPINLTHDKHKIITLCDTSTKTRQIHVERCSIGINESNNIASTSPQLVGAMRRWKWCCKSQITLLHYPELSILESLSSKPVCLPSARMAMNPLKSFWPCMLN